MGAARLGCAPKKESSLMAEDIEATHPGQAHFADHSTLATCKECIYLAPRPYMQIRRFYCSKAKAMAGKWLKPIPEHAIACKYFTRRT
jgi:hypothetical protein